MDDASATIRSVRVKMGVDGVSGYVRDMELMGAATDKAFGHSRMVQVNRDLNTFNKRSADTGASLEQLRTRTDALGRSLPDVDRQVVRTSSSMRTGAADIDRYSGRLSLLVTGIATIGPAVVPISTAAIPAVAGLTAGVGALAAGIGVTLLAVHGLGDGLKALDAYRADPSASNLAKLHEAMHGLPQETRDFIAELDQVEPLLKQLQAASASGLMPGWETGLHALLPLFPQMRDFIHQIAAEMGTLSQEGADSLVHDPAWQRFFAFLRTQGVPIMDAWARAAGNVATGLASLLVDFSGEVGRFDSGLLSSSRRFADWAAGLKKTQGFRDFIDYVHQEGPQVRAFLGQLVDALVAVLQAMAPWGSTVLPILTSVLQLLTMIAGSKVGPVLFDAAAAMLLFSRAAKGAAGLGLASATTAWSSGFKELTAQIKVATMSLEGMGPAAASAQVFARRGLAATALSTGVAKNAMGLGGVLLAGSALGGGHSTLTSTLMGAGSGALIGGAIAGPETLGVSIAIGAAVGGAISLGKALLDSDKQTKQQLADWSTLASTINNDTGKITTNTRAQVAETLRSGGFLDTGNQVGLSDQQLVHSVVGSPEAYDQVISQIQAKITQLNALQIQASGGLIEGPNGQSSGDYAKSLQQQVDGLNGLMGALKSGRDAIDEGTAAWRRDTAALGDATVSLKQYTQAMRNHTTAALGAFDAETQWRQALKEAEAQAKRSNAGIEGSSKSALANRAALSTLAAAWNGQSAAVKNNVGRFQEAKSAFIATAEAMHVPEAEAKRLADRLLQIPKKVLTRIYADTHGARGEINGFKALLDSLHDKTVTVHYRGMTSGTGHGAAFDLASGSADGSTVPKTGLPYADRHLYLLADGEEIISNRYGQADRNRALLKAINAGRLADGGTAVHGSSGGGLYETGAHRSTQIPVSLPLVKLVNRMLDAKVWDQWTRHELRTIAIGEKAAAALDKMHVVTNGQIKAATAHTLAVAKDAKTHSDASKAITNLRDSTLKHAKLVDQQITKLVAREKDAVQVEQKHKQAILADEAAIRSSIATKLRSDVFGNAANAATSDAYKIDPVTGKYLTTKQVNTQQAKDVVTGLQTDISTANQTSDLINKIRKEMLNQGVKKANVNAPLLYMEQNASLEQLQAFAANPALAAQYARAYNRRQSVTGQVGQEAANRQDAAALKQTNKHLAAMQKDYHEGLVLRRAADRREKALQNKIDDLSSYVRNHLAKDTGNATGDKINTASKKGS